MSLAVSRSAQHHQGAWWRPSSTRWPRHHRKYPVQIVQRSLHHPIWLTLRHRHALPTELLSIRSAFFFITFCMRRNRGEMYIGDVHLSVCMSLAAFPHYRTVQNVTWGNGSGCPLVVHYWVDLRLVHRFCCCDNIVPNVKCQRVLVLALCLVLVLVCCLNILKPKNYYRSC